MSYEGLIRDGSGRFVAGSRLGTISPATVAKVHPTTHDIAWAAGIWEGEGSCQRTKGTEHATICQKDMWLLYKFQELFGGSVRQRDWSKSKAYVGEQAYPRIGGEWYASGARARGFLMTIYKFLSPRRQDQVKKALGILPHKEEVAIATC